MSKNKKNHNYVTAKNEAAKARKLLEAKQRKTKKIIKASLVAFVALLVVAASVLGILYASGAFEYTPEVTTHASIEIKDYGSLHIELYGKDAPETVENFVKLAKSGYYNGKTLHKIVGDLMYGGSFYEGSTEFGIKGEFSENGIENKISHIRGTLSMARSEEKNSAYGQFFIVRENSRELDGKYAAFGRITDGIEIIDKMFEDAKFNENGELDSSSRFVIVNVSTHSSHSH